MITSKTKNENYFAYLIFEIIIISVITFVGAGIVVFYLTGKVDTRTKTNYLAFLFENAFIFGLICLLPAVVAVIILLYFRNRNYIIAFQFDDPSKSLLLQYRSLRNKVPIEICIPYNEVNTIDFNEKKFLFNQTYKGKSFCIPGKSLKLDFVTNNFIWEEQPREKTFFLQELVRLQNVK